jgi:uncharacterized protein (DUF433 family)
MLDHAVQFPQITYTVNTDSTYTPNFPYIKIVDFTGGASPVIRGTHIKVWHIIGYLEMGETPETIVKEGLPFLTMAQVQDAQRYYLYHKEEIDTEREENTEEAGRKLLYELAGAEGYRMMTGKDYDG